MARKGPSRAFRYRRRKRLAVDLAVRCQWQGVKRRVKSGPVPLMQDGCERVFLKRDIRSIVDASSRVS